MLSTLVSEILSQLRKVITILVIAASECYAFPGGHASHSHVGHAGSVSVTNANSVRSYKSQKDIKVIIDDLVLLMLINMMFLLLYLI